MFSLIKQAWDDNWKLLSDKDIKSSIDDFWNSVPNEKKTLIISKLKTSVSEENRHEFLIRNSLSKENRKFLIDNFNCTLESDKFVFHQNKNIPIRYIPFVIREASEEEFKYEETTLGRELDENNISVDVLQKIKQLKGGQNYGSYRKTKTGKIMKKKLHLELLSEYKKTNQIDNSISYKKEILRDDSRLGLQDYSVTYWTPDKEIFYEVVEEPCCISANEMTDGYLTYLIVEKIAGNSDFLKKYEEYVEQAIKKQEEELKYYEELRLNRERQRLEKQKQEEERIKRISMIAEERKRVEEKKRVQEEKIIANRERNRQRQLEENQKEKEARKLLEQKKKEEDQALNEAVEAVKENQRSNNPVVSPKSKKSKKNKKKQTLIIEEVSQDEVSQKESTMMSDTKLTIPDSEFFMKNFAGPMWDIYCNNESSQNTLHNTSEPLLKGTLHTEGNKITGAEIYPPVNSQHVLRLPEMPQPPERPPGEFILLNADRSDLIKTSSLAALSYGGHCQNCDTCRRQILHEYNVFLNIANNMENNEKAVQEAVQKLYKIKDEQMPEWVKKLKNKQIPELEQTLMSTKNNECGIEIYFAAIVHPETKERLCYTFIERMYQRLYGKYPVVKKVEIDKNKTPILYRYRDNACAKLFQIKWEDHFKHTTQTESIRCFNDWVMSVNDHQENIFIVSYIYSFIDSYVKNPTMEGEPYNLECFVMVC
jgi:hypothetical protein